MPDSVLDQIKNIGAFLPTTNVWDINDELQQLEVDPKLKELLVRLYQNINNVSLMVNIKDTGYYDLNEFVNGQLFFPNLTYNDPSSTNYPLQNAYRQVYRRVINFGPLPAAGTKTVAHGITFTSTLSLTRMYGAATDPVGQTVIPLPFASPVLVQNIKLYADNTNVVITVGQDYSAYTICYVVMEYIRN
jgi:hypothetical protein